MKIIGVSNLLFVSLFASAIAHADAGLRIICDGYIEGGEVSINGVFRGECPIDLKVPAGTAKVSVRKKDGHALLWYFQELRLGDNSMKKIDVWPLWVSNSWAPVLEDAEKGGVNGIEKAFLGYSLGATITTKNESQANKNRDCQQAIRWGTKAVEAGTTSITLMFSLGETYRDGCGDGADQVKADRFTRQGVELARQAAARNDPDGMFWLGRAYYEGMGVPSDRNEAVKWMRKSAESGSDVAGELLKAWGQ